MCGPRRVCVGVGVCACTHMPTRGAGACVKSVCVQCLWDRQLSVLPPNMYVHVWLVRCSLVSNILSQLPNPYPHPISSVPGLRLSPPPTPSPHLPHPHPCPISPVPHPHPISPGARSSPMSLLPCPRPISPVPRPDPVSPMTGLHPSPPYQAFAHLPAPAACPHPWANHLEAEDTGRSHCLRSQSTQGTGDFQNSAILTHGVKPTLLPAPHRHMRTHSTGIGGDPQHRPWARSGIVWGLGHEKTSGIS